MIVRIPKIQGSCDLVQLQLHVAAGHPLPFKQEDVVHEGHCIEARIYAESPVMTPSGPVFLPCTGTIEHLQAPDPLVIISPCDHVSPSNVDERMAAV